MSKRPTLSDIQEVMHAEPLDGRSVILLLVCANAVQVVILS